MSGFLKSFLFRGYFSLLEKWIEEFELKTQLKIMKYVFAWSLGILKLSDTV